MPHRAPWESDPAPARIKDLGGGWSLGKCVRKEEEEEEEEEAEEEEEEEEVGR